MKSKKKLLFSPGGVVRLLLQSEQKRTFVLWFQAAVLVYPVFPRDIEVPQRAEKGAAFFSQMAVLIRLECY